VNPLTAETSRSLRRILAIALAAVALVTLALILVALTFPGWTALALHWYLVGLGAIAAVAMLRALTTLYPVHRRPGVQEADQLELPLDQPSRLRAIQRMVSHADWDGAGFQLELRPMLRAIARQRLATYRTIDIDRDPEAPRAALGERVWALLTPVEIEQAKLGGGVTLSDLGAAVEALERLDGNPHA
jgi:hypothetical protein